MIHRLFGLLLVGICLPALAQAQSEQPEEVKQKLEAFRSAYASRDEAERVRAVHSLREEYDSEVTGILVKLLTRDKESVRIAAAESLARPGDNRAVSGLAKAIRGNRKRPDVQRAVAKALGNCGSDRGLPALHRLLDVLEEGVALEAVRAIEKIAAPDSVDVLLKTLSKVEMEDDRPAIDENPWPSDQALLELKEPILQALSRITGKSLANHKEWTAWWKKNRRRLKFGIIYWCRVDRRTFEIDPGDPVLCPYDGDAAEKCGIRLRRKILPDGR